MNEKLEEIFRKHCDKYLSTYNLEQYKAEMSHEHRCLSFERIVSLHFIRDVLPNYDKIIEEYMPKIEKS
jgi:hypothetical protein